MQFELIQMEDLSGDAAKIYSVILEGDSLSLLEHFVLDNPEYVMDIRTILDKIRFMGQANGCKAHFFKDKEGRPGDGMVALRYKQMRLYCLRYDNACVFIGPGGYKPPGIAAYQEDEALNQAAQLMKRICASINKAIVEKDLIIFPDGSVEMSDYINLEI